MNAGAKPEAVPPLVAEAPGDKDSCYLGLGRCFEADARVVGNVLPIKRSVERFAGASAGTEVLQGQVPFLRELPARLSHEEIRRILDARGTLEIDLPIPARDTDARRRLEVALGEVRTRSHPPFAFHDRVQVLARRGSSDEQKDQHSQ